MTMCETMENSWKMIIRKSVCDAERKLDTLPETSLGKKTFENLEPFYTCVEPF